MKAVVAAFNQEKALVGAFSVITNLRMKFGCNFLKHYELPTGQLAAEQEGGVVGPHAVGAVVGLLHHLAALPPEVAAGHHLQ